MENISAEQLYVMGVEYYDGIGRKIDKEKGLRYLQEAAKRQYDQAIIKLIEIFKDNKNVVIGLLKNLVVLYQANYVSDSSFKNSCLLLNSIFNLCEKSIDSYPLDVILKYLKESKELYEKHLKDASTDLPLYSYLYAKYLYLVGRKEELSNNHDSETNYYKNSAEYLLKIEEIEKTSYYDLFITIYEKLASIMNLAKAYRQEWHYYYHLHNLYKKLYELDLKPETYRQVIITKYQMGMSRVKLEEYLPARLEFQTLLEMAEAKDFVDNFPDIKRIIIKACLECALIYKQLGKDNKEVHQYCNQADFFLAGIKEMTTNDKLLKLEVYKVHCLALKEDEQFIHLKALTNAKVEIIEDLLQEYSSDVELLVELGNCYLDLANGCWTDYTQRIKQDDVFSAYACANSALKIVRNDATLSLMHKVCKHLGEIYYQIDYKESLKYQDEALKLNKEIDANTVTYFKDMAKDFWDKGELLAKLDDFTEAQKCYDASLEYYNKVPELERDFNDYDFLFKIYETIVFLVVIQDRIDDVINRFLECIEFLKLAIKNTGLTKYLVNLLSIYKKLDNISEYRSIEKNYKSSISFIEHYFIVHGADYKIGFYDLGLIAFQEQKYDLAMDIVSTGLDLLNIALTYGKATVSDIELIELYILKNQILVATDKLTLFEETYERTIRLMNHWAKKFRDFYIIPRYAWLIIIMVKITLMMKEKCVEKEDKEQLLEHLEECLEYCYDISEKIENNNYIIEYTYYYITKLEWACGDLYLELKNDPKELIKHYDDGLKYPNYFLIFNLNYEELNDYYEELKKHLEILRKYDVDDNIIEEYVKQIRIIEQYTLIK